MIKKQAACYCSLFETFKIVGINVPAKTSGRS